MMKLIVDLKSLQYINDYKVDGFIINDPDFSCFNDDNFSLDKISEAVILIKQMGKLVFINIDRIIEEDELPDLSERLSWYFSLPVDFIIYGDYSVFSFVKKHSSPVKLLYNPYTLVTNSYDGDWYNKQNQLVMISNELTFTEVKKISEVGNGVLEAYGVHQIFYSRRLLLSTFQKYRINENKWSEKRFYLKEELRSEQYSIYESSKGSFIYNSGRFCIFQELEELQKHLLFAKINGLFIDEKQLVMITNIYNQGLNGGFSKELFDGLKNIYPNINTSYLYKKGKETNDD
ncbi:MAG: peptidase U32 family protein [Bacilli bacterium]